MLSRGAERVIILCRFFRATPFIVIWSTVTIKLSISSALISIKGRPAHRLVRASLTASQLSSEPTHACCWRLFQAIQKWHFREYYPLIFHAAAVKGWKPEVRRAHELRSSCLIFISWPQLLFGDHWAGEFPGCDFPGIGARLTQQLHHYRAA